MESPSPFLSVVIPLFNEEGNVAALCQRLFTVLRAQERSFEVILVDDGSRDRTLGLLLQAAENHPELVIRSLARNFGQHAAVMAGFAASRGEFVVTLDADLQNPPEEIPRLVAEFDRGHDLVGTIRARRQDSWFRLRASAAVNRMTRRMSGIDLHDFGCMLRGYSREIAHAIATRREVRTFIPALGYLYARSPVEIDVTHESRKQGRSKYSLPRLLRLHLDLMTGFSLAPLRLLFSAGGVVAAAGILLGLTVLVLRLIRGPEWAAQGVFTLFAILFVFIGAQFIAFGLLGEYVGRIFQAVRERPPYVLRDLPGRSQSLLPRPRMDTKPVDTKPVDTKPVDTKPVDTKPVDAKPVDPKAGDAKASDPSSAVRQPTLRSERPDPAAAVSREERRS
jgi:undecaprenyl-phosphate 4-deoxy-4-formamido-L-arabinose transferase